MEEEQLLRPRDVAHILDCCPDDLYPLIYTGEIKAEKVGRLWKFRMEDVMDYKKRVNGRSTVTKRHGTMNSEQPEN
jgi:excisionase family DNA binding protein